MNEFKLMRLSLAAVVTGIFSFLAPAYSAVDIVKIDGSSTVYPITEAVAEEFQIATGIKVTVGVSGTGGGFKKLCRGDTVMSGASRPIKANERKKCADAGIKFIEVPIAFDAITVVLNKKNDWAKELTPAELKKMWEPAAQGKITSWNQVRDSFPDKPLKLYGPGADSGTFDYFTEAINGETKAIRGDFTASEDDNVLVQGVSGDKGGIGYFGLAYYTENKNKLGVAAIKNSDGKFVLPAIESTMDGSYNPLSRPLFVYINSAKAVSDPKVKKFVEFYLKYAGEMAREVGYIPFSDEEYAMITNHYRTLKTGTAFIKPAIGLSVKEMLELSGASK